jgi:hypothetical protein
MWVISVISTTQGFNIHAMSTAFGKRIAELDKSAALVNEIIFNIKIVKFSACEAPLLECIRSLQKEEIVHLQSIAITFSYLITHSALARNQVMFTI